MGEYLNLSNLAIGGVIAAVIAGWTQVKGALMQLLSAFVIQAKVDTNMQQPVLNLLKIEWTRVPTGMLNYVTLYLKFKDGMIRCVPFKALTSVNFFVSRKGFLIVNIASEMNITTFRFVTNLDDLICRAMAANELVLQSSAQDRFTIIKKVGEEKTLAVAGRNSNGPTPADGKLISTSDWIARPNERIEKSFMYDMNELEFHSKDVDPLKGLFYDDFVYKHLEDSKKWMTQQQWYVDRSVPWRRGVMFYGPGSTGKSSLATVTAKVLNVPLYSFLLSTMSDQEFIQFFQEIAPPCVVLFEDFDTVFDGRTPLTEHKSLTFDCVLNQLSGVQNLNGVFLIVTTNNIDKIDPAMGVSRGQGTISTRPGRIDNVLYLGVTSVNVRQKMVAHVLRDWPECHEDMVVKGDGMTAAQFQELCIQYAFDRIQ